MGKYDTLYRVSYRLVGMRERGLVIVNASNQGLAKRLAQWTTYKDPYYSRILLGPDDVLVDDVQSLTRLEKEELEVELRRELAPGEGTLIS